MVRIHHQQPRHSQVDKPHLPLSLTKHLSYLLISCLLSTKKNICLISLSPVSCLLKKHLSYLLISCLLASSLLASCTPQKTKQYDPAKVNFTAQVNPLFDNQLYPSLILATSQPSASQPLSYSATQPLAPLTVSVTAPTNNAVLRIVVDSSSLNYVTILQEILPSRGTTYTFQPSIKWKYERLRQVRQRLPVDLTLTCYINDEETDIRNLHFDMRSVNECPLSLQSPDGTIVDTRWLFAAYVNEEHPQIQPILSDILSQGIVSRLQGYQAGSKADVLRQIQAVWYNTLLRGISYASISCTSNPSPRANVQHIRFFDEVWNTRQANCIDACVYLASIFRKIGLRPVIFVEPCHAYLGVYNDKNKKNITLIETTITSWVNFPELLRSVDADGYLPDPQLNKISKYLSAHQLNAYRQRQVDTPQLLKWVALSLFEKASQYNLDNFRANQQYFADPASISFQQLDIETLRQTVQPIN